MFNPKVMYRYFQSQLWFKPLIACVLSIGLMMLIKRLDVSMIPYINKNINVLLFNVTESSVEKLLDIISSTMLAIATFSVASMVSAYSSASSSATPRVFNLLIEDDTSQNALSIFIGAFIFSVISLIAIKNDYYDKQGLLLLFLITLIILAIIILTFVRWVDKIARLGRVGTAIEKVEMATTSALKIILKHPTSKALPYSSSSIEEHYIAIYCNKIGFIQNIDVSELNDFAKKMNITFRVNKNLGMFISKNTVLAYVIKYEDGFKEEIGESFYQKVNNAFDIGKFRDFKTDTLFGLTALTEIASRALSPGINDPGTAIEIIHRYVNIFSIWQDFNINSFDLEKEVTYQHIEMPILDIDLAFSDAFYAIIRDGAGNIELMSAIVKSLKQLKRFDQPLMSQACEKYIDISLKRAKLNMDFDMDFHRLNAVKHANDSS